jgi:hypothetical protein
MGHSIYVIVKALTYDYGWHTRHDRVRRNVASHHRTGGNDGTAADADPSAEHRSVPDPDVILNDCPALGRTTRELNGDPRTVVDVIIAEDRHTGTKHGIPADLDSWIEFARRPDEGELGEPQIPGHTRGRMHVGRGHHGPETLSPLNEGVPQVARLDVGGMGHLPLSTISVKA